MGKKKGGNKGQSAAAGAAQPTPQQPTAQQATNAPQQPRPSQSQAPPPFDAEASQGRGRGRGKVRGKGQEDAQVRPGAAPQTQQVQQPVQVQAGQPGVGQQRQGRPPAGAWGGPQATPAPQQRVPPGLQQQPTGAWGRPQTAPAPQQQAGGAWGKPQPAPTPQQPLFAPQQGPPPQQQQTSAAWGKKQPVPAPQQQLAPALEQPQDAPTQGAKGAKKRQPKSQQGGGDDVAKVTPAMAQVKLGSGDPSPSPSPSTSSVSSAASSARGGPQGDSKGLELPVRKNKKTGGTIGRKIDVRTNFMPLNLKNICQKAIHYDITFDPDKPKRFLKLAFNKFCTENFPGRYPAFDGVKNVYASSALPQLKGGSFQKEVKIINPDNGTEKTYNVTIKFASYVDMTSLTKYMDNGSAIETPQEALQCIDIVFRHALSQQFVQVGKSFFTPPTGRVVSLGDGMDLWYGLFSSCILGWKPYLNVDIAHKGFPTKQLVTEYMTNEKQADLTKPLTRWVLEDVRKFIKSLKVQYEIPGKPASRRSFRVNDICSKSADQETFVDENNKTLTVVQYFREAKGYIVKYPKLPCLWVGNRNKKVYVPPELCTIQEGQVVIKKLTEIQTRNMIKQAATSTGEREQKIMGAYKNSGIENNPVVKEFNLHIDSKFEKVSARVLEPPQLQYKSRSVMPRDGVWRADQFLKGASLQNWTVLNTDQRTRADKLEYFCGEILKSGRSMGINIAPAKPPTTLSDRQLQRELPEYFKKAKQDRMELVFVVISSGDAYAQVKQVAELKFGILTQCLTGNTMFKLNPSTVGNILLKVNAKLNGTNYQLSTKGLKRPTCLNTPVMVVGADVTHPSPDQSDIPSVVGVAASHDPNAFNYNMIWRLQLPKIEIIEDLQSIMREHLIKFYRTTGQKPQAIYFFRDGVSEGQFKQVLNTEFPAIRRACQSLQQNYQPPITMLVVQKRHHTRFFPSDADAVGRHNNVPPGTVVDTHITHPTEMDFYLVSHASIQGVARPTKYRVLWDDNNLTEDQLQELTYFLCHMFSRCTRAVSYPTPTYYAHLAAYRGRVYIEGHRIQLDNLQREQQMHCIQDEVHKDRPMFFV